MRKSLFRNQNALKCQVILLKFLATDTPNPIEGMADPILYPNPTRPLMIWSCTVRKADPVTRLKFSTGPIRPACIAYTRAMSEHRCFPKKDTK